MKRGLLTDDIIAGVKRDNCFDFLRYLFALSLIIAHFCTLTDQDPFWFITGGMRVKAFFTITGFLVSYSFLRRQGDIRSYAVKRLARIVPAYVCCIAFCLLLGWWVTDLSTYEFFHSIQTLKYVACNLLMMNWIEPELPGVFQDNAWPQMDGSLWSMKQEMLFYALVPMVLWVLAKMRNRGWIWVVVATGMLIHNAVAVQIQYFMFFFTGMTLLLYFDLVVRHIKWLLPIAIVLSVPVYVVEVPYLTDICQMLDPLVFGIIIIGLAYSCRPLNVFRRFDNVTYGMYLYHFPIIQLLIYYGVKDYDIRLCFVLTLVLTSILACMSWYLIEKPLINRYRK